MTSVLFFFIILFFGFNINCLEAGSLSLSVYSDYQCSNSGTTQVYSGGVSLCVKGIEDDYTRVGGSTDQFNYYQITCAYDGTGSINYHLNSACSDATYYVGGAVADGSCKAFPNFDFKATCTPDPTTVTPTTPSPTHPANDYLYSDGCASSVSRLYRVPSQCYNYEFTDQFGGSGDRGMKVDCRSDGSYFLSLYWQNNCADNTILITQYYSNSADPCQTTQGEVTYIICPFIASTAAYTGSVVSTPAATTVAPTPFPQDAYSSYDAGIYLDASCSDSVLRVDQNYNFYCIATNTLGVAFQSYQVFCDDDIVTVYTSSTTCGSGPSTGNNYTIPKPTQFNAPLQCFSVGSNSMKINCFKDVVQRPTLPPTLGPYVSATNVFRGAIHTVNTACGDLNNKDSGIVYFDGYSDGFSDNCFFTDHPIYPSIRVVCDSVAYGYSMNLYSGYNCARADIQLTYTGVSSVCAVQNLPAGVFPITIQCDINAVAENDPYTMKITYPVQPLTNQPPIPTVYIVIDVTTGCRKLDTYTGSITYLVIKLQSWRVVCYQDGSSHVWIQSPQFGNTDQVCTTNIPFPNYPAVIYTRTGWGLQNTFTEFNVSLDVVCTNGPPITDMLNQQIMYDLDIFHPSYGCSVMNKLPRKRTRGISGQCNNRIGDGVNFNSAKVSCNFYNAGYIVHFYSDFSCEHEVANSAASSMICDRTNDWFEFQIQCPVSTTTSVTTVTPTAFQAGIFNVLANCPSSTSNTTFINWSGGVNLCIETGNSNIYYKSAVVNCFNQNLFDVLFYTTINCSGIAYRQASGTTSQCLLTPVESYPLFIHCISTGSETLPSTPGVLSDIVTVLIYMAIAIASLVGLCILIASINYCVSKKKPHDLLKTTEEDADN